MPTQRKIDTVAELSERIARSTLAVATAYLGLTVAEMGALRRQLREAGVELRVIKNSLFRRAAQEAGKPAIAELAEGPTAIAFAYGDIVAPARALADYVRTAKNAFAIRRGFTDGQSLSVRDLEDLARLPSREVLIGQVAGALQAPLARLSYLLSASLTNPAGTLLNSSLRDLQGLLGARAAQLEGA
jgi:large subunit ribosomal protein L10